MNSEHVWGCDWAVWCEWNLQISPHFIQDSSVKTDLRWKKSEIISPHGSLLRKKKVSRGTRWKKKALYFWDSFQFVCVLV